MADRPYCDGRSADLSTDRYNCGECGNICQPDNLAYGLSEPRSLVADSNYVYWAEQIEGGRIFQLPWDSPATFDPPAIVSNQQYPRSLVVDAANLYWVADDGLWMRPIAGGDAVVIGAEPGTRSPGDVTLDETNLYWTTHSDTPPNSAAIKMMPLGGGTAIEVASMEVSNFKSLAVDGTSVYWVYTDSGSVTSQRRDDIVYKAPLSGGTPVEVHRYSGYTSIRDLATDANYLYIGIHTASPSFTPGVLSNDSSVERMPLAGGETEPVITAPNQVFAGFGFNAQGAFLASNNGNVVGGTLRFTPSGVGTPFSTGWPTQPTALGVSQTHLYLGEWEERAPDEGAVYRLGLCVDSVCQ
jgi:hypothetical protein